MMKHCKVALISSALVALSQPASAQTLKVGVLATLSGAGTAWGISMQGAAELAAEDVNSKGGLDVGGKKYKIEVVSYDDHYKAADALTATNRLIFDDGIKFIVGPARIGAGVGRPAGDYREQGAHHDDGVHAEGAVAGVQVQFPPRDPH